MKSYLFLAVAILFETAGTTALKFSEQFTRPVPAVATVVSYIVTFYFLSLALKTIPIGVAYGIWAGAGIALVTLVGIVVFKQIPDLAAIVGIALIVAGVVAINFFSKMSVH